MEKLSNVGLASSRSQSLLKKYHQLTSPIVSMHTVKQQECLKDELKNNVNTKLENIKNRGSKLYALDTSLSFSELKASSILYQIPEFSTPEINYEVADQIKRKVEEMKNQIITHLPEISKSSNYAPKKIEHQLNHRSAVRELEQWLKQKLKNPPQNYEESVEYKNMIMGIGMKELIRIIGKRCREQGRMAEQIWELTWNICREIIIYLSKRAKKCEDLLEEELTFMRDSYEKEFRRLKQQNTEITARITNLMEENKEYASQITKLRKRKQVIEDENKTLTFDNYHIREQFKKVLEQNLAIYLQIGNKSKRDWIKKMYKSIMAVPGQSNSIFKELMKQQVAGVMEDRIKQQEITEDCSDRIETKDIQEIEKEVQKKAKKQKKTKAKKGQHITKKEVTNQTTMITELETVQPDESIDKIDEEQDPSLSSCNEIVNNMRQQFKTVEAATSTQEKVFADAFASTASVEYSDMETEVSAYCLNILEQIGVNTEEIKDESKNIKKKINKQNSKQDSRSKVKPKINATAGLAKDKSKGKFDNKKLILDVVQEEFQQIEEQKSEMYDDLGMNELNPSSDLMNPSFPYSSQTQSIMINSQAEPVPFQKTTSLAEAINSIQKSSQTQTNSHSISLEQTHSFQKSSKVARIQKILSLTIQSGVKIESSKKDPQLNEQLKDRSYISAIQAKYLQNFAGQQIPSQFCSLRSNSLNGQAKQLKQIPEQGSKIQAERQCLMYICAECHKIITADEEKFANPKLANSKVEKTSRYSKNIKAENIQQRKSENPSPYNSLKKMVVAPEHTNNQDSDLTGQRKYLDCQGRKVRRNMTLKTSGYNHDISFKKELEQQHLRKSMLFSNSNHEYPQVVIESEEVEQNMNNIGKISPFKLLYNQIMDSNKDHISLIVNAQQQVTENLENYFDMVKQISGIPESKIMMTEKAILSTIQKNIFPIITELLLVVRKAVKYHHINETMKMFTSLPNIIYNRISRKYGVKILAVKNLKLLLMALKAAGRYTQKYKVIELMMFTDCKSAHSQDLFMYLLIMGLMDPTFASNKILTNEQLFTIKSLCQQHLTKQRTVYADFDHVSHEQCHMKTKSSIALIDIVKSIITNYRLLKINRIEELGFIFVMLKKDHWMEFKNFIYFLTCLPIRNNIKVFVIKKLLQYCDIKNKDQKIGITENMFAKFLMDCEVFTFEILNDAVKKQMQDYYEKNKEIMAQITSRLFVTKTNVIDQLDESQVCQKEDQNKKIANCITQASEDLSRLQKSLSIDANYNELQRLSEQQNELTSKSMVLKQLKEYSWLTEQICSYLQSPQQLKYVSPKQHCFIKEYLMVHLIESQIQKVMGIADYFSNSMLEILSMSATSFSVYHIPHSNK